MKNCIVTFKGTANLRLLDKHNVKDIYVPQYIPNLVLCKLDDDQIKHLRNEKDILAVELDDADSIDDTFDESSQEHSYAIDLMEVKRFHDLGFKGQGVKVAVFDTGIQKHEDLVIVGGINAFDQTKPFDADIANAHGTKVAGVIGMQDNDKGYLGVAPECELYAVRLDDGSGSNGGAQWSEQIVGMNWAIENDIDVINCSFSGTSDSVSRRQAFKAAHDAGITIFCSANNRQGDYDLNIDRVFYPAIYPFVITSANINQDKSRYKSSSVGPSINFASGGVNITSTSIDSNNGVSSNYASGTGTSYASPAVAGMFALYKQMYPHESREKVLQRMYVNTEKIGNIRYFGAGIPKFPDNNYENIIMNESLE